jgi:multiple sugar transport system permease protein
MTSQAVNPVAPVAAELPALVPERTSGGGPGESRMRSFILTFFAIALVAAFLSPLVRALTISIKTPDQISQPNSPVWPADPATFSYSDEDYELFNVPQAGGVKQLALVKPGRTESDFIDPANPTAAPITVQGSWRQLDRVWTFAPEWGNYAEVWDLINYPRLLLNTIALATISTIGVVLSCTLVAYGFARFRFPGRQALFTLLIATIFLPTAVTLIPTYTIFYNLGWVGTWLPLLVPTFLANAYDVFLLRQYFLTIPRDLDEAAAIDGAGPLRTLWSVVLPQAWPALVAVAIFTFVYTWNDFFGPLIYLSTSEDLWPISVGLASFNGIHYRNPALVQAGTLMALVIPVLLFIAFQRFFTRGIVISGVEK